MAALKWYKVTDTSGLVNAIAEEKIASIKIESTSKFSIKTIDGKLIKATKIEALENAALTDFDGLITPLPTP